MRTAVMRNPTLAAPARLATLKRTGSTPRISPVTLGPALLSSMTLTGNQLQAIQTKSIHLRIGLATTPAMSDTQP